MAKKKCARKHVPPEERLARYWRRKAKLRFSDFDAILGKQAPADVSGLRSPALEFRLPQAGDGSGEAGLLANIERVSRYVLQGYPLSFREYHLAIAFGWILSDLPYEEFYKTRWFENSRMRAYAATQQRSRGARA